MEFKNVVDKVIYFAEGERSGAVKTTADRLGVKVQSFEQWRIANRIPPRRAKDCEMMTDGVVSLHEMNPEIFPPNATWLPAENSGDAA